MKPGWLRKTIKLLIGNLFVLIFLLCIVEGGLYMRYRYLPKNESWLSAARQYYRSYDADVIQFNLKCSKHHPTLTYTLRPETSCDFNNAEFKTRVTANRMGFRDDEKSLDAPEIIVLGDSHTLGWGIAQKNSYTSLLEKALGIKVLNTGQSSYGTAREVMMLDHLDRSNLKALIIQYADNDNVENGKYISSGFQIKTMSRTSYDITRKEAMKRVRPYRFGNFMRIFWPLTKNAREALHKKRPADQIARETERNSERDAIRFLKCLANGPVDLSGIPIYLIEVNGHNKNDPTFIRAVERLIVDPAYNKLNITTLDVSPLLQPSDYFTLDEHMKPAGHQIIADVLAEALQHLQQPQPK